MSVKKRSLTAVFLSLCSIGFILAPIAWFIAGVVLLVMVASYEWCSLSGVKNKDYKFIYMLLQGSSLIAYLCWLPLSIYNMDFVLALNFALWLGAIVSVFIYPRAVNIWRSSFILLATGIVLTIPFAICLIYLKAYDVIVLAYIIAVTCSMDIGAYLVGRKYGKHKVLPLLSPGKSYEGFCGGMMLVIVVTIVFALVDPLSLNLKVYMFAVIIAVLSIVGDFFESLIKRVQGIKDSGSILPGHGGIFDRLDSLLFSVPLFTYVIIYFNV